MRCVFVRPSALPLSATNSHGGQHYTPVQYSVNVALCCRTPAAVHPVVYLHRTDNCRIVSSVGLSPFHSSTIISSLHNSRRDHTHSGEEHRNRHRAPHASRSHRVPPLSTTCHLSDHALVACLPNQLASGTTVTQMAQAAGRATRRLCPPYRSLSLRIRWVAMSLRCTLLSPSSSHCHLHYRSDLCSCWYPVH